MLTGILLANGNISASILSSLFNENLVKEGKRQQIQKKVYWLDWCLNTFQLYISWWIAFQKQTAIKLFTPDVRFLMSPQQLLGITVSVMPQCSAVICHFRLFWYLWSSFINKPPVKQLYEEGCGVMWLFFNANFILRENVQHWRRDYL